MVDFPEDSAPRQGISRRTALGGTAAVFTAVALGTWEASHAPAAMAAGAYMFPFSPSTITARWGVVDAWHPNGHRGLDFAPGDRAPIPSVAGGVVVRNEWNSALGNILLVDHQDGYFSGYCHMVSRSPIGKGSTVQRGTIVGNVGTTGTATSGPHLHLTIGSTSSNPASGATIDPEPFIRARTTDTAPNPTNPNATASGDNMIRIQSTNRGIALIGAGYYRQLSSNEEVEQSTVIMEKHITGNDRQFDLWVSMALTGRSASSV
ncbi:M23 family metallopeptidase [Cryobacterium sp. PH31-O1]|uniref:M23 family metallopeptidase n=1 Tax=Cryobacterium sp. PH31-O1 TaxID=3046306 RepID=UPI0024BA9A2E|nr:M23 family metallopeptidase [Cryobacterium sp. PH31-O1]MDJ0337486.1 M23 family metallopeptidase [Cryobacterium sp. PH31-O1]